MKEMKKRFIVMHSFVKSKWLIGIRRLWAQFYADVHFNSRKKRNNSKKTTATTMFAWGINISMIEMAEPKQTKFFESFENVLHWFWLDELLNVRTHGRTSPAQTYIMRMFAIQSTLILRLVCDWMNDWVRARERKRGKICWTWRMLMT